MSYSDHAAEILRRKNVEFTVDSCRSQLSATAFGRQGPEVRILSPRPFSLVVTGSGRSTVFFIVHVDHKVDDSLHCPPVSEPMFGYFQVPDEHTVPSG